MTAVEEITTGVATLPEQGQREVLDFVEFLRQRQCGSSLHERGRELARRARQRNAGIPSDVIEREIEQAIDEVRQQGRVHNIIESTNQTNFDRDRQKVSR